MRPLAFLRVGGEDRHNSGVSVLNVIIFLDSLIFVSDIHRNLILNYSICSKNSQLCFRTVTVYLAVIIPCVPTPIKKNPSQYTVNVSDESPQQSFQATMHFDVQQKLKNSFRILALSNHVDTVEGYCVSSNFPKQYS